jgi:hypothetical protein
MAKDQSKDINNIIPLKSTSREELKCVLREVTKYAHVGLLLVLHYRIARCLVLLIRDT